MGRNRRTGTGPRRRDEPSPACEVQCGDKDKHGALVHRAPDIAIADDVSLLKTNQVAAKAVADGKLDIPPELLSSHYNGAAVGDSIVQITTTAPSYPLAAAYANALAKAFLAVQANVQGQTLRLQLAEYNGDLTALNAQISNLTNQIAANTPAAPAQPTSQQSASIQNFTNQRVSDIAAGEHSDY